MFPRLQRTCFHPPSKLGGIQQAFFIKFFTNACPIESKEKAWLFQKRFGMISLMLTTTGYSRPGSFLLTQIARDSLIREGGGSFVVGCIKSRAFFMPQWKEVREMAYNKKFWKSKQQAERMVFGMIWTLLKDGYRSGEIKELCREEYSLGISEAEAIMFNSERRWTLNLQSADGQGGYHGKEKFKHEKSR